MGQKSARKLLHRVATVCHQLRRRWQTQINLAVACRRVIADDGTTTDKCVWPNVGLSTRAPPVTNAIRPTIAWRQRLPQRQMYTVASLQLAASGSLSSYASWPNDGLPMAGSPSTNAILQDDGLLAAEPPSATVLGPTTAHRRWCHQRHKTMLERRWLVASGPP